MPDMNDFNIHVVPVNVSMDKSSRKNSTDSYISKGRERVMTDGSITEQGNTQVESIVKEHPAVPAVEYYQEPQLSTDLTEYMYEKRLFPWTYARSTTLMWALYGVLIVIQQLLTQVSASMST